jgi:putative flippase GtrA
MKAKPIPKAVRFVVVGGVNTVFGYLVFAGLTALGWADLWAVPAAMAAGVVFNFLTYGTWVFASLAVSRLPRFVIGYLGLYLINVLALRALAQFGLDAYRAQALLLLPLAALAYLLNDRWVFRGT